MRLHQTEACAAPRRHWAQTIGLFGFFLAISAMFVWSGETAVQRWINHDAANALYIGGRLLRGDVLYVDWYYFVTPPIVLWSAGVYFIAEHIGLWPSTVFHLVFVATTGLGVGVLSRSFGKSSPLFLLATLGYLSILVYPGLKAVDLGQREHLFVLLLVPYLVWRFSETPASCWVYLLLGYLGFVMMIKPHFVAVIAVTELFFVCKRRQFAMVWTALLVGGVAPFALLALHSTDALVGFFERAVPYHLSGSYEYYGRTFDNFAASGHNEILLWMGAALSVTTAAAYGRGILPGWKAAAAIAVTLMLYASVLQQGKFFPYHTLPFYGVTLALTVLGIGQLLTTVARPLVRRIAMVAAAAGLLILIAVGFRDVYKVLHKRVEAPSAELFPHLENRRLVMLVTPVVEGDFYRYLLSHDLEIIGPWSSNYTVPGLLATPDPGARRAALQAYFEPLAAKLRQHRPDLVLFSPERYPRGSPSMHDVFVKLYGTFPTPDYEFWRRTRRGWVLYQRRNGT